MPIERSTRPIAAARLGTLARGLLDRSTLCAIATVSPGGRPYINTAYFAWTPELDLVWLSEPKARHSRNVRANAGAAVGVYESGQVWGNPDRGIQLLGTAREVAGAAAEDAARAYAGRFRQFRESDFGGYRLYRFRPTRVKLFDELALGPGTFVIARVRREGRLYWERTEIYRR